MSEKKQKYAYWMRPSMVAEIEEMLPAANATSKGDFICKAVEFYIGYLRQQKNINYLAPMLAGAIKSEVRSLGKDVCEMLFNEIAQQKGQAGHVAHTLSSFGAMCRTGFSFLNIYKKGVMPYGSRM